MVNGEWTFPFTIHHFTIHPHADGASDSQVSKVGFPIRKSTDQSLFAAPHGLSQRITSFIACACQGIHQMPLRHLIVLIANDHHELHGFGRPFLLACARRGAEADCPGTFTYAAHSQRSGLPFTTRAMISKARSFSMRPS
jgi:hypothetical protein